MAKPILCSRFLPTRTLMRNLCDLCSAYERIAMADGDIHEPVRILREIQADLGPEEARSFRLDMALLLRSHNAWRAVQQIIQEADGRAQRRSELSTRGWVQFHAPTAQPRQGAN